MDRLRPSLWVLFGVAAGVAYILERVKARCESES
jgi:hypothetical protein